MPGLLKHVGGIALESIFCNFSVRGSGWFIASDGKIGFTRHLKYFMAGIFQQGVCPLEKLCRPAVMWMIIYGQYSHEMGSCNTSGIWINST